MTHPSGTDNPEAVVELFSNIETAVNQVLPGSNTHSRYAEAGEVGLAIAVTERNIPFYNLNLLDPATIGRLSFFGTNREQRPDVWTPKPTDARTLGFECGVPLLDSHGRFSTFAIAKIATLAAFPGIKSSHSESGERTGPGIVGIAGGIRTNEHLIGASGLWEVHDHVVSRFFSEGLSDIKFGLDPRTVKKYEDILSRCIAKIARMHEGKDADQLSRIEVARIIHPIDNLRQ